MFKLENILVIWIEFYIFIIWGTFPLEFIDVFNPYNRVLVFVVLQLSRLVLHGHNKILWTEQHPAFIITRIPLDKYFKIPFSSFSSLRLIDYAHYSLGYFEYIDVLPLRDNDKKTWEKNGVSLCGAVFITE